MERVWESTTDPFIHQYTTQHTPQPVVVFSKTKEGGFFPATIRPDYALLNDTGLIFEPTLSELRARVLIRYAEVHDKVVPYEISIADVDRMRRRKWRGL